MTVYLCRDDIDGILCGVYDAWMSRKGHSNVKLQLESCGNLELFCTYYEVEVTEEKIKKVIGAIRSRISEEAFHAVCDAALSHEENRADDIYRFLISAFHYGKRVMDMLQLPEVYEIFRLRRNVGNETHLLTGFVRFVQMDRGVLAGMIGPKNDVLILLAPFFADRLSGKNWILYDEKRRKAALHPANRPWFMVGMAAKEWDLLEISEEETVYKELWKTFHRAIAIKDRTNPVCQKNHLPLHYRPYMTEFNS